MPHPEADMPDSSDDDMSSDSSDYSDSSLTDRDDPFFNLYSVEKWLKTQTRFLKRKQIKYAQLIRKYSDEHNHARANTAYQKYKKCTELRKKLHARHQELQDILLEGKTMSINFSPKTLKN